MEFKDKLKQVRLATGMSQHEAAEKMNWKHSTLSEYETGRRQPTIRNFIKPCRIYDCKPNDLIDVE